MNQKITKLRNFSRVFLNISLLEGIYYSHKQHKIRAYLVFCIDLINFGQANFAVLSRDNKIFSHHAYDWKPNNKRALNSYSI